jgi:iodotyrosine deiodinase
MPDDADDDTTLNEPLTSYAHPYPSPSTAAEYPFAAEVGRRRSVRMIGPHPVPLDLIESAITAAATTPSGAHHQPWQFDVIGDPVVKRQIRLAAEDEERTNDLEKRMNAEWQAALAPLGTDHHKEFLEIAPSIVVLFEERFGRNDDGSKRHHYDVKESCGIAAGTFITALHHMGLVTLTHTPSPMAFLTKLLGRPDNERPFVLFQIGFPLDGAQVPDLHRKSLAEVRTIVGELPISALASDAGTESR